MGFSVSIATFPCLQRRPAIYGKDWFLSFLGKRWEKSYLHTSSFFSEKLLGWEEVSYYDSALRSHIDYGWPCGFTFLDYNKPLVRRLFFDLIATEVRRKMHL